MIYDNRWQYMTVQVNVINCRNSEKEEVAVNQGEKDCENMLLFLLKIKFTAYSELYL